MAATAVTQSALVPQALLQLLQFSLPPFHHASVISAALSAAATLQAHSTIATALASHQQQAAPSKAVKAQSKKGAAASAASSSDAPVQQTAQQQLQSIIASLGSLVASDLAAVAEVQTLLLHAPASFLHARHLLLAGLKAAASGPAQSAPAQTAALSVFTEIAFLELTGQHLNLAAGPSPSTAVESSSEDASPLLQASEGVQDVQTAHVHMLQSGLLQGLASATAVPYTSPANNANQEQNIRTAFAAIASLPAAASMLPHLQALVKAYTPEYESASLLLANIHSSPAASAAVQCAAFEVQRSMLSSAALLSSSSAAVESTPSKRPPASASKAAAAKRRPASSVSQQVQVPWVCHALAALGSPTKEVRSAAVQLLLTLTPLLLDGSVHISSDPSNTAQSPSSASLPSFLTALLQHAKAIVADAGASSTLLQACFVLSNVSVASEAGTSTPPRRGASAAKPMTLLASATTNASSPWSSMTAAARAEVRDFLCSQLPLLSASGSAGAPTALSLLHLFTPAQHSSGDDASMEDKPASSVPAELFEPAMRCLQVLLASALPSRSTAQGLATAIAPQDATAAAGLSESEALLVSQLLTLLTPDNISQTPMPLLILFAAVLQPPSSASSSPQAAATLVQVRLAALSTLQPALFLAMPPALQPVLLKALLAAVASGSSMDATSRASAVSTLDALPLSSQMLHQLLTVSEPISEESTSHSVPQSQQKGKRGKKDDGSAAPGGGPATNPLPAGTLESAVPALELLQTRGTEVSGRLQLVTSLQQLLLMLLPVLGSIATPAGEDADSSIPVDDDDVVVIDQQLQQRSSLAGYAAQLVLVVLGRLANAQHTVGGGAVDPVLQQFDLSLAVKAAQEAPDSAVRNAALSLVAALATLKPDDALGHVLQVRVVSCASEAEVSFLCWFRCFPTMCVCECALDLIRANT